VILLHRLDGSSFYLNADLVEMIEANPDTVLTLNSARKFVVREPPNDIIDAIVSYRRRIFAIGPQLVDKQER
jgi:flagellar protein FlbD